jgi:hypothetical protein
MLVALLYKIHHITSSPVTDVTIKSIEVNIFFTPLLPAGS